MLTPDGPPAGRTMDELLAAVSPPDRSAEAPARQWIDALARRDGLPPDAGLGDLATLAIWWAQVRAGRPTQDPVRAVHVVPSGVQPLVPPATVRTVPLDPPAAGSAIGWGADLADELVDTGVDLIVLTVADSLGSRILAGHLLDLDPVEANGWPRDTGVDDDGWMRDTVAIRDGLRRLRGLRGLPHAALEALAGPRHAAGAGLLAGATVRRTPVLLDGLGASTVALLIRDAAPAATGWWQVAHLAPHPLHAQVVAALGLDPLIRLGIGAEDGTGGLLGLSVVDLAARLLAACGPPGPQ